MKAIRVVTFNIRHGLGTDNKVDIKRVADVLSDTGFVIAGLQEVDKYRMRSRFFHQPRYLARLLSSNWAFGTNTSQFCMQYGNAVISRYPLLNFRNYHLPSHGERRGLLEVEVELLSTRISFFCTHLGLRQEERIEQIIKILDVISAAKTPVVLVGDFNCGADSHEMCLLMQVLNNATTQNGEALSHPSARPEKQIDFVFLSNHWHVNSVWPVFTNASDHVPVVAEIAFK